MMLRPFIACVALALLAFEDAQTPVPTSPPAAVVSRRVQVLRDWVAAVERHTPGKIDEAAESVLAWSRTDVRTAWIDVQTLVDLLTETSPRSFFPIRPGGSMSPVPSRGPAADIPKADVLAIQALAAEVRARYDPPDPIFKRAALLHGDIAMSIPFDDPSAIWASMLSPRSGVVRVEDGRQTAIYGGIVHWEFGRVLLDAVRLRRRDDFVRAWYLTTMAHKLQVEDLDTTHFEHARFVLPDAGEIRFLLGCLHEALADRRVQTAAPSAKIPPRMILEVRSERDELRQAEGHFRHALEINPKHDEVRLHLGRTLGRLGRHKEAAAELRRAVEGLVEPRLRYYAQLFLGAEEEALGRLPEARAAYQAAGELYPRAQSPKLALSQLAHRLGDRAVARTALAAVLESRADEKDDDPWWTYRQIAGRHANAVRDEMNDLVSGRGPR